MGHSGMKIHLYGKADVWPGRRVGHVNCVGISAETMDEAFCHTVHMLGL